MKAIFSAILTVSILFLTVPVRAAEPPIETKVIAAKVKIYEWFPPGFGQGRRRWPLILFSHGLNGCAAQSKFLMEALAEAGYMVAAPDHADATCGRRAKAGEEGADADADDGGRMAGLRRHKPQERLGRPDAWTDRTYKNRADDIAYTLGYVLKDPATGPFIDQKRLGLAGHSLGGYTVMGIAGAWPSWKDRRYKAVLALSPYANPLSVHGGVKNIDIPVMYQGGTRDFGVTPFVRRQGGIYDQSHAPKYFVEFSRAGHFSFSDLVGGRHDVMNDYAIAFFDKYLLGKNDGLLDTKPGAGVADYRAEP